MKMRFFSWFLTCMLFGVSNGQMPSTDTFAPYIAQLNSFFVSASAGKVPDFLGAFAKLLKLMALHLFTAPIQFEVTLCEWIELHDYKCLEYNITTDDGYILALHRIFGKKGLGTVQKRKYPILFSHGILTNGMDWTISGKPKSLAFELADDDFDVWMISHRGSDLSDTHVTMKNTDAGFYNFSFQELGIFDLPATIDFIVNATQRTKVIHVGFSQGGAAFYAMFAEKPDYTELHVAMHIGLSPAVHFCHSTNIFTFAIGMLNYNSLMTYTYQQTSHQNFLGSASTLFKNLGAFAFNIRNTIPIFGPLLVSLLVDYNPKFLVDRVFVPFLVYKNLKVTGSKQILHFTQNSLECNFYKYRDFPSQDLVLYNMTHKLNIELHAFTSCDDHFVSEQSIDQLKCSLTRTCLNVHRVEEYYHINMVYSAAKTSNYRARLLNLIYNKNPLTTT